MVQWVVSVQDEMVLKGMSQCCVVQGEETPAKVLLFIRGRVGLRFAVLRGITVNFRDTSFSLLGHNYVFWYEAFPLCEFLELF